MTDSNLDMSQYMSLFLDEASENLGILEQNLLRLEQEAESDPEEILQQLFRSAHTLKGSSRAMGFEEFGSLTHRMEDLLDKLRKKELAISAEIIDVLLGSLDALAGMKADIGSGGKGEADTSELSAKLGSFLKQQPESASSAQMPAPSPAGASYGSLLSESEKAQVRRAEEDQQQVWLLEVVLAEDCAMKSVRAMMVQSALQDEAAVIRLFPSEPEMDDESSGSEFAILVSSVADRENLVGACMGVSEVASAGVTEWSEAKDERIGMDTPSADSQSGQDRDPGRKAAPTSAGTQSDSSSATKRAQTVRVDVSVLDNLLNLAGELVIDKTRIAGLSGTLSAAYPHSELGGAFEETAVHLGRISGELQDQIMRARMLPIENLFNRFPRMVRDLAQKAGKELDFHMEGRETELDRSVIEAISDPLIHLLRNSVDHGVELPEEREAAGKPRKGTITLAASHKESHIIITVADDGKGIDPAKVKEKAVAKGMVSRQEAERMSDNAALNLIFAPGLSTAEAVSDVSGRGVGMDIVKSNLQQISGQVRIKSKLGLGTKVSMRLPLTLAIIRALLVRADSAVYALPLMSVVETISARSLPVHSVNRRQTILHRGNTLPLVVLHHALLGKDSVGLLGTDWDEKAVVVAWVENQMVGFVVDALIGEQEVVVKSLAEFLGDPAGISGATILGDGSVALIIDVPSLVNQAIQGVESRGRAAA
jgi:two-component system chemotaxis sensor kinase CheA